MPLPTRQNTPNPHAAGLHCALGDTYYRLVSLPDAAPLVSTAPLQPPRIDTSANPEDIHPEAGTTYSLSDFTGGEGLDFAHRRNATDRDPTRFWSSSGIDVSRPDPGSRTVIALLPATEQATTGTGVVRLAHHDGTLFASDATNVKVSANPLAASPSFSTEDPHAGEAATTVADLTLLGDVLHAALGANGIHQRTSGGVWSHWSDLAATRVWTVKGRVLASTGTALYEAKSLATSVLLHTLASGESWTAVVDGGSHVLAAATDGNVYAFTFDESAATLTIAARTPVSDGPVTAMASLAGAGLVFYALADSTTSATASSIHRAAVTSEGTLSDSQTIREFVHDSDNQVVSSIHVEDEDVWFGQVGELWRYDLVTTGRVRDLAFASDVRVTSLLAISGRIVAGLEGQGVHRQATTYVDSGYAITPLVDHFTASDKSWSGISVDLLPVVGGVAEVYYSTDPQAILDANHASWKRVKRVSVGIDTLETSIKERSRYLALKVVLYSDSNNAVSPGLRSVGTRAFPGAGDIILTLPINSSDQIEAPGRARQTVPGLGRMVHNSLKGLEGTSIDVELFDPAESIQGFVESVATQVPVLDVRGSRTMVSVVKVRGSRTPFAQTFHSVGQMGSYHPLGKLPEMGTVKAS